MATLTVFTIHVVEESALFPLFYVEVKLAFHVLQPKHKIIENVFNTQLIPNNDFLFASSFLSVYLDSAS